MSDKAPPFFNRELSWLEFNQRVLDEACDDGVPPLERLKFLAITASNLDEFFMVRVGGLTVLISQRIIAPDPAGMTPQEQLAAVDKRVRRMIHDQYSAFQEVEARLAESGIRRLRASELADRQFRSLEQTFESDVFPVLTPMAVRSPEEFPLLGNQALHICVQLAPEAGQETPRFALIPLGRGLSRALTIAGEKGYGYVLLEDVVALMIGKFFPGETITATAAFRITRNADFALRDDLAPDLMEGMQGILSARKHGRCVRLEISDDVRPEMLAFLKTSLGVADSSVYLAPGPVDLAGFFPLADLPSFESLRYEPWSPQASPDCPPGESMFNLLAARDVLLYHPYQSFEPVVRLIQEAAKDPDVLAIKQILYRTSRTSPIVIALAEAARRGKYVTAVVELKARFDEARNIEWARSLEEAGVQVIYGVRGLKTHAKVCVIVRRESRGVQRYVHFGTGNYNEITSRIYSDASLMTNNDELGADAVSFFNAITGYSLPQHYKKIEAAPLGLRNRLLELIESEAERKKQGQDAFIDAKLNALTDEKLIQALYEASQAGVAIRLNVRGACCLRPGVPGLSDNISVVSIVDRYLEHARILHFHHGGDDLVFISSADWMSRNLDRRIELLTPVDDALCRNRLIAILSCYFDDNTKARQLRADGQWTRVKPGKKKRRHSQQLLHDEARKLAVGAEESKRGVFVPHRNPNAD